MADNPLRGTHDITFKGRTLRFFYGWDELAKIESQFGAGVIAMSGDPVKLPTMAFIGLQRYQPEIQTEEDFKALEIPLMKVQAAVIVAMKYAYYGDEEAPKDGAADIDPAKKNPRGLRKFGQLLSLMAFARPSSGR